MPRPASQLEFLERVKTIAILGIFSDDRLMEELVLKGGNALDIAYRASNRASEDLDFSMGEDFEPEQALHDRIERGLVTAFREHDLVAFDVTMKAVPPGMSDDIKSFWGGYRVEFKVTTPEKFQESGTDIEKLRRTAEVVTTDAKKKFCIDISKHEVRDGKVSAEIEGLTIFVYSPAMIVAEKIRAICQQLPEYGPTIKRQVRPPAARAKDFFDIYKVCEQFGIDFSDGQFQVLVRRMFAIKHVPLSFIGLIHKSREFHRADFISVTNTVRSEAALLTFDGYFDYVLEKCRGLESLWNDHPPG